MPTPHALMTAYLASLEARRIPFNTIKAYRADLTRFVALMPGEMEAITVAQIEAYLGAGGVSEATSRRRHACLRSFYQWLIAQEENPMARLKLGATRVRCVTRSSSRSWAPFPQRRRVIARSLRSCMKLACASAKRSASRSPTSI